MSIIESDYLIIGTGIIGLSLARELKKKRPEATIILIEKEDDVAQHGSGRNSGVLHAGFYYTAHSLKAQFTRNGNKLLTTYCKENNLQINNCGKVVVTKDESELESLMELERRAKSNGIEIEIIDEEKLKEIEPNAKTYKKALFSPTTSTVDPGEICECLKQELIKSGVKFFFNEAYKKKVSEENIAITKTGKQFKARKIINAAGLYADKIALDFGHSKNYTIIPFKGVYLKYTKDDMPIKMNIYPVPNLKNPFLGVHYTVTVANEIKIGPTAIPAFWRENYKGLSNFRPGEFSRVLLEETRLFLTNSFNFRSLAFEEVKKYFRRYFIGLAKQMVNEIDSSGFTKWTRPGIRAQLLDKRNLELVQDFVVESDDESVHILNAVSPAFTCSFSFSKWVVDTYICQEVEEDE